MKRTERIWTDANDDIDGLCHLTKNLYNEGNYIIRQEFFKNGLWTRYDDLNTMLKQSENYRSLNAQSAQQTLRLLDKDRKSFFKSIKDWKVNPEKYKERPRIPRYKKKDGKHILIFTNQQAKIKNNILRLPKKIRLEIKTRLNNVKLSEVRVIPKGVGYVVEIVYEKKQKKKYNLDKKRIAGIDLGGKNLITMGNNIGVQPIVVKGGILQSINQYFNKEKARIQSVYDLQKIKQGNQMKKLFVIRERKIHDNFHKISKYIVKWCIANNIGTLVIGHNDDWKQNINIGKRNNQSFVSIPFHKLTHQVQYKSEEVGIDVIIKNEDHTSKCSFLDDESIEHHNNYMGKRISRGLFKSAKGIIINVDVQGSYNIIKKAIPKAFADGIEGVHLHPKKVSPIEIAHCVI